jgi:hypothetical protein
MRALASLGGTVAASNIRSSARRDPGPPDLEFLTLAQDRIILLFVMGRVAWRAECLLAV